MAYFHGVKTSEKATAVIAPVQTESGLIVAFGTAPVHLAKNPAAANEPILCYEYAEFVDKFGWSDDFEKYTLCEVAYSQFVLFGMSPIVFVNVLDKATHYKQVTGAVLSGLSNPVTVDRAVILDSLKVIAQTSLPPVTLVENTDYKIEEDADDETYTISLLKNYDELQVQYTLSGEVVSEVKARNAFPLTISSDAGNISLSTVQTPANNLVLNEDYAVGFDNDGKLVFTLIDADKAPLDEVELSYKELDAAQATKTDIIGGIDLTTDKPTGLELIETIYPKFRIVPGIIIAPKYSTDVTVAAVMKAKATGINDVFRAVAIVDLPETVTSYTDAPEYKNLKNLVDTSLIVCYPKLSLNGVEFWLSTQLASLMNYVDANLGDDIPYYSPSNHNLQCDSTVLNGEEKYLTLAQANYLNSQGIVTAINFANGWVAWGDRTSIYPSSTDAKDVFISVRRMFNWLANQIILTYFQEVDLPTNRRFIDSIVNSVNIYLNGLTAKGALLGGELTFLESDNPTTSLLSGIVTFHLDIAPPIPAEHLHFDLEYQTEYLSTLFS